MSLARGSQNGGHYYSNVVMPQEVDVQFTVKVGDTGGLGITGLKSNGWARYVFMHTSATAGVVDGITNPNPASGIAIIQLKQNFNAYLGMDWNLQCVAVTGGTVTTPLANTMYLINSLGTTTAAQWVASGFPVGVTPALNAPFIGNGVALGGTGNVKASTPSAVVAAQVVGSANTEIANSSIAANGGAYIFVQFLSDSDALVAPEDNSIISIRLFFDRSSVTVDGL